MRIAVMVAASVLVAACSSTVGGPGGQSTPPAGTTPSAQPTATKPSAPATTSAVAAPTRPPATGTPITQVIRWIEAGRPADGSLYHAATRGGVTTQLGEDVAFTTPSGEANCMTDARSGGALACLVKLAEPPPQPQAVYGEWKGGWVDFPGPDLEVGSVHGDPGRFSNGVGPELPYGSTLAFGDYRCRADADGLFCVNYAHQSAARFSAAGIEPYGCLGQVTAPPDVGVKYACQGP